MLWKVGVAHIARYVISGPSGIKATLDTDIDEVGGGSDENHENNATKNQSKEEEKIEWAKRWIVPYRFFHYFMLKHFLPLMCVLETFCMIIVNYYVVYETNMKPALYFSSNEMFSLCAPVVIYLTIHDINLTILCSGMYMFYTAVR
jgi:hypothetical protein